jgi:murein DD-endopeptidase MepM/ murein hydrolase activator NlpD
MTIIIDHGAGLTTLYAHASSLLVQENDWVQQGQLIARVGSTGHSNGPHLHFEVRLNEVPYDPLHFLAHISA